MAGKSTFLRQNAAVAILAQMGSFVPAESAHIGIVDRLFSRVGAADDLARGRSTFMVEMVETAAILNQATEKSLVILDEIGRGTATFDGLAIAWATAEHLCVSNKSRGMFATHYHEMTALAERLPPLACVTMRVREWNDSIVFLHEVAPGVADRSYGIHVAKLAGLPAAVVGRAEEVLRALEEGREGHKPLARIDDLPLFAPQPAAVTSNKSAVEQMLRDISPDALTPKQALELLYQLKAKLGE
jgi:DNA mismatch repair protein MutS